MARRTYIVDRIEDEAWAVLEADDGSAALEIPREWLPRDLTEGQVVEAEVEEDGLVRFRVDSAAAENRVQRLDELRGEIPGGPEGDLEL